MYTRELSTPRNTPIENGIPVQGTWTRAFREVDLLAVRRPYRFPLPRYLLDTRIKEWETFIIQGDQFFLEALLVNVKFYRMAQVFLYDRERGERIKYLKVIPFGGWKLPRNLYNSAVDSHSVGFFFRVHSWLDADTIRMDLDIAAKARRPALTAHLMYDQHKKKTCPLVVNLGFSERRCVYAYKTLTSVRGDVIVGGKRISLNPACTSGFFFDVKGFYPYPMQSVWCTASGFDGEGRRIGFTLAENQTRENRRNNENALWVNGELSPLPAVRITLPAGIMSEWIIQDVEGMVDLVFTPLEQMRTGYNVILSRADMESPLGYYNGMIMSAGGEQIQIRSLFGTGKKLFLRV